MRYLPGRFDRREVLCAGLAFAALAAGSPISATAAGKAKAYVASGGGDAVSLLDDPDYRKVFAGIFSGLDTTFASVPGRDALLDGMMAADLVYLSIHSNSNVIQADTGSYISIGDIIRKRRTGGRAPRLVIIAGCLTLDNKTRTTLPRAFGIEEGASGSAYIGFAKTIIGRNVDAFFRVFLALWLRQRGDGGWRTLDEARGEAITFIEARIADNAEIKAMGNDDAGKLMKFAAGVPGVGRSMMIVGDSSLRLPDLTRPAAPVPSTGTGDGGSSASPTPGGTPTPAGTPTGSSSAGPSGTPSSGSSWAPSGGSSWSPGGSGNGSGAASGASGSRSGTDVDAVNDMLKR